jgi:hypothetical protein
MFQAIIPQNIELSTNTAGEVINKKRSEVVEIEACFQFSSSILSMSMCKFPVDGRYVL